MNEVEHRKEVFAWFGAAAYYAQCFEQQLIILLMLASRVRDSTLASDDLEQLETELSKKTMGALIRELKRHFTITARFEQTLRGYLDKRNYLAHRFFYQHSGGLSTKRGRDNMLTELKSLSESFKEADVTAQEMTEKLYPLLGWPLEEVEAFVDSEVKRLREGA